MYEDLSQFITIYAFLFFSVRLLSVLRGHSFFSSSPQRTMTSDFEGFSIPEFIHYIYFPILILKRGFQFARTINLDYKNCCFIVSMYVLFVFYPKYFYFCCHFLRVVLSLVVLYNMCFYYRRSIIHNTDWVIYSNTCYRQISSTYNQMNCTCRLVKVLIGEFTTNIMHKCII